MVHLRTQPLSLAAEPWLLRPWRPDAESDRAALLAAVLDPQIAQWNPIRAPDGTAWPDLLRADPAGVAEAGAAAQAWCARMADWSDGTGMAWAVTEARDPDHPVGYLSVHRIDAEQATAEVGYWVLPQARLRGLAAAALRTAAAFCFGPVGLHRIELYHAVENIGSCRAATRAGFRLEGRHRLSHRFGDGAYHDEHSHARLSGDPVPGPG